MISQLKFSWKPTKVLLVAAGFIIGYILSISMSMIYLENGCMRGLDTEIQPVDTMRTTQTPGSSRAANSTNHKIAFIGIFSTAERLQRRALIRETYLRLATPNMDVRFIFGKPKLPEYDTLLKLEASLYGDVVVLNISENMNDGKTFAYFDYVAHTGGAKTKYDFVAKIDDDVWLHLPNFEKWLHTMPRDGGVYFGRNVVGAGFMAGMGYGLSWDLVEWIGNDTYPRTHQTGQEDAMVANWLNHGSKIKHWATDTKEQFYDDPSHSGGWEHPYTPDTILIHRLKEETRFLAATKALMPSLA